MNEQLLRQRNETVALLAPGIYVEASAPRLPFFAMSGAAAIVVASYGLDVRGAPLPAWIAWARAPAMIALALGLGAWMLRASPAPRIDVWQFEQQAAEALLHGRRVYGHGALSAVDTYSPGRTIDGFLYPPLTLALCTAGYAILGDARWAQLAAILAGAALLRAFARKTTKSAAIADLLMAAALFHPRGLFVLEQAWVEPLALPFLGAFAFAAATKRRRLAAIALGLLCAVKQHFVLYLPALVLWPAVGLEGAAIALAALALTYLPFVVTSPSDLWATAFAYHLKSVFRPDSLSLPALLSNAGILMPAWIGFAATAASFAALRWIPRALGPLLFASTLPFILFYVLGRQAFCNYYYLLGPTWLFAAAALTRRAADVT